MDERVKSSVPADPGHWSEKSKHSISYHYKREYTDIDYVCWRCKAPSVFTAEDQKYTFEVKKASVDQRRILCGACWSESNKIRALLENCESEWVTSKKRLQRDSDFLKRWLELLVQLEEYVPYKPDIAKKNMLKKLLSA
ncbi:zinc-ribbon domain containing protein [Nevskia soli]|uniref:zinc-ribbon domain containing protein n=1 Tax=Nevskia soli TaxID=418856 RepID=UPI000A03F9F3|nr:zinc-ribbon domain containing protein [Nevskia soli]